MTTNRIARITPLLVGAALLVCSAPAFAEGSPADAASPKTQFGDAHQFALAINDNALVNQSDVYSAGEIQASFFVIPHLSLGLALGAQWLSNSGSGTSEVILHVGPRVGYDIPLSDFVSFWPQLGVDYRRIDSRTMTTDAEIVQNGGTTFSTTSSSATNQATGFTLVAPLVIHPTSGFFVGAGPVVYTEVQNSSSGAGTSADNSKTTSVGLMATIGGAI